MASDAEIRHWARQEGIEVPPRGRLAPAFRERYAEAHPDDDDDGQAPVLDGDGGPAGEDSAERPPAVPEGMGDDVSPETPPRSPHRPRLQLLGGGRRAKSDKPKRTRRRVSLESTAIGAWELLAGAAARSGLTPTARVLGMQAPVAGVILEDALRGSMVDRILQPVARAGEKSAGVYALLAPPLIVSALSMHPERAPVLLPVLRGALRQWVLIAGPALHKRQKAEQKALDDLELPEGQTIDTLVESWLEMFFAPEAGAAVPDAA